MSNDRTVHALTRGRRRGRLAGSLGAAIARRRRPLPLADRPLLARPPSIVAPASPSSSWGTTPATSTPSTRATGQSLWATPADRLPTPRSPAPRAGSCTQYGGVRDLILVGTRDGQPANAQRLPRPRRRGGCDLHPRSTGRDARTGQRRAGGRLRDRSASTSRPGSFVGGATPSGALQREPRRPAPHRRPGAAASGTSTRSPVLRNGRVYLGDNAGTRLLARRGHRRRPAHLHDRATRRPGEGLPLPRPPQRRPHLRDEHQGLERLRRRHAERCPRTGSGPWPASSRR